jgi:hypothetical protein
MRFLFWNNLDNLTIKINFKIMNKRKKYLMTIISGLILLLLGFVFNFLNLAQGLISLIFINAGIIMIVVAAFKFSYLGAGISQDEFTRKLSSKAISYSWFLTFVVLNILFWIDYFGFLDFKKQTLFSIIIFTMLFSAVIFKKLVYKQIDK